MGLSEQYNCLHYSIPSNFETQQDLSETYPQTFEKNDKGENILAEKSNGVVKINNLRIFRHGILRLRRRKDFFFRDHTLRNFDWYFGGERRKACLLYTS